MLSSCNAQKECNIGDREYKILFNVLYSKHLLDDDQNEVYLLSKDAPNGCVPKVLKLRNKLVEINEDGFFYPKIIIQKLWIYESTKVIKFKVLQKSSEYSVDLKLRLENDVYIFDDVNILHSIQ